MRQEDKPSSLPEAMELAGASKTEEVWNAIPGWEGIYQVSNLGRVASLDRHLGDGRRIKGRIMKLSASKSDTTKVNLCTGERSVSITRTVSQLVLLAFVGPPADVANVRARHRDGDHKNNRLENLYWGPHAPRAKNTYDAFPPE